MGDKYTDTKKRITNKEIKPGDIINSVKDDQAGAIDFFIGTIRNFSEAGKIEGIFYESYITMAEESMKQIENEVSQKWDVKKLTIIHRVGNLTLGDISLAVAVSTPHRDDAFKACRYIVERIKHEVPIWKKEKIVGGEEKWVSRSRN